MGNATTGSPGADAQSGGDAASPGGNVAELAPDGPLCLTGRIQVEVGGEIIADADDVALCRCGHSANKPFCDGSHREIEYANAGVICGGRLARSDDDSDAGDPVTIVCAKNGPLLVRGPLTVVATDGATATGSKGALCRCGLSASTPFCDGSHRRTGFVAD